MLRFYIILILITWVIHVFSFHCPYSKQRIAIHSSSFSRLFEQGFREKSKDDSSLRIDTKFLSKNNLCDLNDEQFEWLNSFVGGFRFQGKTLEYILSALKENSKLKVQLFENMNENKESLRKVAEQINDISNSLKSFDEQKQENIASNSDSLLNDEKKIIISDTNNDFLLDKSKMLMEEKKMLMNKEEKLMNKEEKLMEEKKMLMDKE